MSSSLSFIISLAIIMSCAQPFQSQETANTKEPISQGSRAELKNKHSVWLLVRRSSLLDATDTAKSILNEIYAEGRRRQNYPYTYNLIAKKLNKYMREHASLTAARNQAEAEFILYFNVLEIRRPLGAPYA